MTATIDEREARLEDGGDPYWRIVAYCADTIADSPAELERVARVKLLLVSRGIAADDQLAADWLAPALCTNAEEQKRFHQRFDDYVAKGAAPAARSDEESADGAGAKAAVTGRERIESHALKHSFALGAVPVAIGGWILWGELFGSGGPQEITNVIAIQVPLPTPVASDVPLVWDANWGAILLLVLLAMLGSAAFLYTRARRARMMEGFAPAPRAASALVRARDLPTLFSGPNLSRSLGVLRRHKEAPSRRIAIRGSIRATIRAGGRSVIRFGLRPVTPEYLLMADHQSPRDHLPMIADALQHQFAQERIVAERYDYFGKAGRLRPMPLGSSRDVPIEDIAALNSGARVIALAEARELEEPEDGNGEDNVWMSMFRELDQPTLLDPRPPRRWSALERQVEDAGVLVIPATPQGLEGYAERLSARGTTWPARWATPNRHEDDAVARLLADSRRLLDPEPPAKPRLQEILSDLERSLGADALLLLRTAALHPVVDPALTLHLAANLDGADGGPMLSEANFLAVARLPWMRTGHMPGWLRAALVRELDSATTERAVGLIQSYLLPKLLPDGTSEIDEAEGGSKADRLKLLAWIGGNPESELYDPLFFDALKGAPPHRLGIARDPNLPGRPLNIWRVQDLLLALALLFSLGLMAWVNPPFQRVPDTPDDTTQEPPTDVNKADPVASNEVLDNATATVDAEATVKSAEPVVNGENGGDDPIIQPVTLPPITTYAAVGPFHTFFDWQKDEVTPAAAAILDNAAAAWQSLARNPPPRIRITGYDDRELSPRASLALTQRRAAAVAAYLVARGVPSDAIEAVGAGQGRSLVPTADGVREPQNRRVEIIMYYPDEQRPAQQPAQTRRPSAQQLQLQRPRRPTEEPESPKN